MKKLAKTIIPVVFIVMLIAAPSYGFDLCWTFNHGIEGVSPGSIKVSVTEVGTGHYLLVGSTYHDSSLGDSSEAVTMVVKGAAVTLDDGSVEATLQSTDFDDWDHTTAVEGLQITNTHMILDSNWEGTFQSYTFTYMHPSEGNTTPIISPLSGTVSLAVCK